MRERVRRTGFAAAVLLLAAAPAAGQTQRTANPHGPLPSGMDCSTCHTAEGWTPTLEPMRFEHGEVEGFRLSGAHEQVACVKCHEGLRFDGPEIAPAECASCHADVHEGAMLGDCAACHVTTSFRSVDGQRIHAGTAFPLTGAHQQLTCVSCHADDRGGAFSALPSDCVSCHLPDYEGARTIDHVAAAYPTDCTECHATTSWRDGPRFDHVAASGGFELAGAHRRLACAGCHEVPGLRPLFQASDPGDCVACHQDDYDREHAGSRFSTQCASCHSIETWEDPDFDHALTGFALVGLHGKLGCSECHGAGRALKFPVPAGTQDCVACHKADYDEKHAGSGYPTTCLTCHKPESWDAARFDHAATRFPLLGAHTTVACATCHGGPGGQLLGAPTSPQDCVACHRDEYDRRHAGSGYPTTCTTCHSSNTSWAAAVFNHSSTRFPLVGAHTTVACATCHLPGGQLLGRPATTEDCVACHKADYDAEHTGSGFPTTCLSCHSVDSWGGARVDHTQVSGGFRLLGAHATSPCAACHGSPGYTLLFPEPANDQDCVACHRPDYDGAHAGSGFPTTCTTCHGVQSWASTFDHDAQFFRIYSGRHAEKWSSCAECHTVPSSFASFTCLTCHVKTQMDEKHKERQGYVYESGACYSCHRNS